MEGRGEKNDGPYFWYGAIVFAEVHGRVKVLVVDCKKRGWVGHPKGGQGFGARGFPFASLIETGVLVWDRSGLGEELRSVNGSHAKEWSTLSWTPT